MAQFRSGSRVSKVIQKNLTFFCLLKRQLKMSSRNFFYSVESLSLFSLHLYTFFLNYSISYICMCGSGSRKLLDTDSIRIRIHNTGTNRYSSLALTVISCIFQMFVRSVLRSSRYSRTICTTAEGRRNFRDFILQVRSW